MKMTTKRILESSDFQERFGDTRRNQKHFKAKFQNCFEAKTFEISRVLKSSVSKSKAFQSKVLRTQGCFVVRTFDIKSVSIPGVFTSVSKSMFSINCFEINSTSKSRVLKRVQWIVEQRGGGIKTDREI